MSLEMNGLIDKIPAKAMRDRRACCICILSL
jgi:hypothetical protein